MTEAARADPAFGPWNPGIQSQIPADLLPLATIFRPEHVRTTLADAQELADLTGLPLTDIVAFRPERLALHEVLVRVTADISVPDGERIEDLGISFRAITRVLLERHIAPQMAAITAAYERVRRTRPRSSSGSYRACSRTARPPRRPSVRDSSRACCVRVQQPHRPRPRGDAGSAHRGSGTPVRAAAATRPNARPCARSRGPWRRCS